MKMMKKIYIMSIVILLGYFIIPINQVNARVSLPQTDGGGGMSTSVSGLVGHITADEPEASDVSDINGVVGNILSFLQVIAGLILVITIAYMGFEMVFNNNVNAKEELKKKLIPLIVGTVLVFGTITIANFILNITA